MQHSVRVCSLNEMAMKEEQASRQASKDVGKRIYEKQ
jgi:hypothetical protein